MDYEEMSENGGDALVRLDKDLRGAAKLMSCREARYLVDLYNQIQKGRVAAGNQIKSSEDSGEPAALLSWTHRNALVIEADVKVALNMFAKEYSAGQWLQGICGIGPVLSASLLASLDIRERLIGPCTCKSTELDEKHGKGMRVFRPHKGTVGDLVREFICTTRVGKKTCGQIKMIKPDALTVDDGILRRPTAGAWWKFAGLDPSSEWKKGKRRPWNAALKVTCWKAGEQFWRQKGRKDPFYGDLFVQRKDKEIAKNEAGENREYALNRAEEWRKKRKTGSLSYKSYLEGRLPDAHVHARARRYTLKIFLSHFYEFCYREYYGEAPLVPYVFEHGKGRGTHQHYIQPPVVATNGLSLRKLLDR